jgi:hypothetical protein
MEALRAGRFDCQAYDIWYNECQGREKLCVLRALAPVLQSGSPAQQYAKLLVGQMTDLLSLGCSDELLTAAHQYCDSVHEMVRESIELAPCSVLASPGSGAPPWAWRT